MAIQLGGGGLYGLAISGGTFLCGFPSCAILGLNCSSVPNFSGPTHIIILTYTSTDRAVTP